MVGFLPGLSRRPGRSRIAAGALALLLAACSSVTDRSPTRPASPVAPQQGDYAATDAARFPALFAGYDSARTPHFPHLRLQVTDYRIQYQSSDAVRATEYAWTAAHVDRVILDYGDTRSVSEYRRLNPALQIYRYALQWTVMLPGQEADGLAASYYAHMQSWYAAHPEYQLERAFLHDGTKCGTAGPAEGCRVTFTLWSRARWALNPGDAGLRAYQGARLSALAADADGLFLDEHASGDMRDRLQALPLLEYPDWSVYESDMVSLLGALREELAPKRLLLNTSEYIKPWDRQMIAAAGGSHAESFDNPFHADMERRWDHVDSVLAAGATVDMPPGGDMPASYTAGGFDSPAARAQIWRLAAAYLVAPAQVGALYFNPIGGKWDAPFSTSWLPAVEANIGAPVGARHVAAEGTDATGRHYRVWARDYQGALVLVRPLIDWSTPEYGDATGVAVPLPTNDRYRPLAADGSLGEAVDHVTLRASEAAILVKESALLAPPAPPAPADTAATPALPGANLPPLAKANGPYSGAEGAPVSFTAAGSADPEGSTLAYHWDFGDGTSAESAAPSKVYPDAGHWTVRLTVTDSAGAASTDSAEVTVADVPPTATFVAPSSITAGSGFTLALTGATDPSPKDRAAGFTYQFDCGEGWFGAWGTAETASCGTQAATGTLTVRGRVRDGYDYGVSEYRATVAVASAPTPPPAGTAALLLVLDRGAINNDNEPQHWTAAAVNDDVAAVGLRSQLRWFAANVGTTLTLYSGWVGDEGFFAIPAAPASWASAGPTTDALRNYLRAGPGLGTADAGGNRETLLGSIPDVTPLRATGLKMLVGRTVCAVVLDNDVGITSYAPLRASLRGDDLGVVAFTVNGLAAFIGDAASRLPKVSVTVRDATQVCGGALEPLVGAPQPTSGGEPFDVTP